MRGGLRCCVLVWALFAPWPSVAFAQGSEAPAEAPAAATAQAPADVVVFNRTIVTFRATVVGLTPTVRAEAARRRVLELLEEPGEGTVDVVGFESHHAVRIDGQFAFLVADADADPLLDETGAEAARRVAAALGQVVRESRESRDRAYLARAGAWALAYTLGFLLAVFVLRLVSRAIGRVAARRVEAQAERVRVGGVALVSRDLARSLAFKVLRAATVVLALFLTYQWLGLVLRLFPYTRPWGEGLAGFLVSVGTRVGTGIVRAIPGLFVALVIFLLARWVVGVGGGLFDRVAKGELRLPGLDAETVHPTRRLFAMVVWVFALAMAYPYLPGSDSAAFQGLSVLVGVMFSLGGASTIAQGLGGIILIYSRSFRVGDYVRIGEVEGTVTSIRTFQTRLRTGMGEEVILPNGVVLGSVVHNFSHPAVGAGFIVSTSLTIGYDAPWRKVHTLLEAAARATPGIASEPPPRVFQTALSDFFVEYRLVCVSSATLPRPRAELLSLLNANIQDQFNAAGIQIMSPHYEGDPVDKKVVAPANWGE